MQLEIASKAIAARAGQYGEIEFRRPTARDGSDVWALVGDLKNLDDNSMYCNLLQCTHFADTCAVAEIDGEVVGWISGYLPPSEDDTLFVWQVAVAPAMRGRGVAKGLVRTLLERPACASVRRIQSTITRDNEASWALFGSVAEEFDAHMSRSAHFKRDLHFDGEHATEYLVEIGPIERGGLANAA